MIAGLRDIIRKQQLPPAKGEEQQKRPAISVKKHQLKSQQSSVIMLKNTQAKLLQPAQPTEAKQAPAQDAHRW